MPDLLRTLGLKKKRIDAAMMPRPDSFVDIAIAKARPGRVCIEKVAGDGIVTSHTAGMVPGAAVILQYENPAGKFRFTTRVRDAKGQHAVLELPARIDTLSLAKPAPDKGRGAPRVDLTLPTTWRFATGGKAVGESARGTLTDLSRGGAGFVVDREIPMGVQLELKLPVTNDRAPLAILAETVRTLPNLASGKRRYGLRFVNLTPVDERAINDFINRRQSDRRTRGLA